MTSECAESLVRAGHPLHAIITEASPSYHGDDAMSFTMKNAPPSLMPAMVKLLLSASRSQDPEGFNARHTSDMLQCSQFLAEDRALMGLQLLLDAKVDVNTRVSCGTRLMNPSTGHLTLVDSVIALCVCSQPCAPPLPSLRGSLARRQCPHLCLPAPRAVP